MLKVLVIGDIMGRPGREAVTHYVPRLRRELTVDFVVGNAENAAGGRGLTPAVAEELFTAGVDVVTMGNHTWARPEIEPLLKQERVLRPANYPPSLSGRGAAVYRVKDARLAVIQVMGRTHLANIDCPFRTVDRLLDELSADAVIVDMHAEATSEKQAMGWYLNGRVAAVVGTHTHVQTADERILPDGTATIADIGMTGPRDGIIGGKREAALRRFLTGVPARIEVADGDAQFCAVALEIDPASGRARGIERQCRLYERPAKALTKR